MAELSSLLTTTIPTSMQANKTKMPSIGCLPFVLATFSQIPKCCGCGTSLATLSGTALQSYPVPEWDRNWRWDRCPPPQRRPLCWGRLLSWATKVKTAWRIVKKWSKQTTDLLCGQCASRQPSRSSPSCPVLPVQLPGCSRLPPDPQSPSRRRNLLCNSLTYLGDELLVCIGIKKS